MFKMHELRELIKLIDQSSIQKFELESEGNKVTIKKTKGTAAANPVSEEAIQEAYVSAPAPRVEAVPIVQAAPTPKAEEPAKPAIDTTSNLHKIVSPMVGTFYSSPSPEAPAYVSTGSRVNEKTIVCIVEAMKLMNEIEAEVRGEIVQVLVENGQLVEYGQPLFLVKAE